MWNTEFEIRLWILNLKYGEGMDIFYINCIATTFWKIQIGMVVEFGGGGLKHTIINLNEYLI